MPARALAVLMIALAVLTVPAHAVQPDEVLADPVLEARARELSRELRCMVCQNQSIDDSDAPLARDLRILVRERLEAGDTDRQVRDFLVDRYGEFVLMRPSVSWRNALLWAAPILALFIGLLAVARMRRAPPEEILALTPEEEERVRRLLAAKPTDGHGPTP